MKKSDVVILIVSAFLTVVIMEVATFLLGLEPNYWCIALGIVIGDLIFIRKIKK